MTILRKYFKLLVKTKTIESAEFFMSERLSAILVTKNYTFVDQLESPKFVWGFAWGFAASENSLFVRLLICLIFYQNVLIFSALLCEFFFSCLSLAALAFATP